MIADMVLMLKRGYLHDKSYRVACGKERKVGVFIILLLFIFNGISKSSVLWAKKNVYLLYIIVRMRTTSYTHDPRGRTKISTEV